MHSQRLPVLNMLMSVVINYSEDNNISCSLNETWWSLGIEQLTFCLILVNNYRILSDCVDRLLQKPALPISGI